MPSNTPQSAPMTDLSTAWPEVRAILERSRVAPPMNTLGIEASRDNARRRTTQPPREEVHAVTDSRIAVAGGNIALRLYRPSAAPRLPLVIYLHAGGWILGDLEHSDHLCRRLANRAGAAVLNVDYRLAPEHRYPVPLDDCEAALRWAVGHAGDLGIDPARVALAGESSGAHLAATLALRGLRIALPSIAFVLLLAPALDAAMDTASWRSMGTDCVPVREQMAWMWDCYLPGPHARSDGEANPAAATHLDGHPPALIVGAEFDPLRDEAEAYAARLAAAGVAAQWRLEPGLMHAFSNLGGAIPQGLAAFDRAVATMTEALARPAAEKEAKQ